MKFSFLLFLVLSAISNMAVAATYAFNGPKYTTAVGGYTTAMSTTGTFTTTSSLPANMAATNIGPSGTNIVTSWSFNDGIYTYTTSNSILPGNLGALFSVATDSSGNVDASRTFIGLLAPSGTNYVGQSMNFMAISGQDHSVIGAVVPCSSISNGVCTNVNSNALTAAGLVQTNGTWTTQGTQGACTPNATTACLQGGRFKLTVNWKYYDGTVGAANLMKFNGTTAANDESTFWTFQTASNYELGIKVLSRCAHGWGNTYQVLISALTDQGWTATLTDTVNGNVFPFTHEIVNGVVPVAINNDQLEACQ